MDGSVVIPCRQVSKADRAGYTVAMVERAMRLYDAQGREATVEYYNSPESVDGERYVFIYDENEKLIALVVTPDTLGADLRGDVGVDFTGYRHTGVETFLGGTARRSDFRFRLVSEFAGMDAGGTRRIGVGLVDSSFQPL